MGLAKMQISQLKKKEIAAAIDLVTDVFREFVAPDYSEEGTATFKEFIDYASITQKLERGEMKIWGSFSSHRLSGVIASLKTNHICLLFVRKKYQRQGIARALFEKVIDSCRLDRNISSITVNSSPYAVEAYRRLGFKEISAEKTLNGIRFIPMEYSISRENRA
jgi:GNAT superfamily N-acetyltransferase